MTDNRTLHPAIRQVARAALAAAAAFSAVLLAPPGTPSAEAAATADARTERVHRAYRITTRQLGDPYRSGAAGPRAFDCSGLTYYAFHRAGFRRLPRTSSQQAHFTRHIRRSRMRPGDLVFFRSGGHVYHVGVFAGWRHRHRTLIHSPYPGTRVRRERIWTSNWFAGTLR
jgi:cell wall-associated NlpC family hydrolase